MRKYAWVAWPAAIAVILIGVVWAGFEFVESDGPQVPVVPAPTTTSIAPQSPGPPAEVSIRPEAVVEGLDQVVYVTSPPGEGRLFLVEKDGRILVVEDGALAAEPFLDITADVLSEGVEQGLVGLAFHPGYGENRRFFIYYTDREGDSRVVEYLTDPDDPGRADPDTRRVVLAVDQPHQYHNAGMLQFGPDGMLYVALGDGGGIADQYGNGQSIETLLGAILRISVDGREPYAVPADNPFVGSEEGEPAIWVYGLRNPWRFWIDAGLLYIGDVGQEDWEEIDVVPLASPGANFGWSVMEGDECFEAETCAREGLVVPVLQYGHGDGCAVVGGVVYRGEAIPELDGHYFYGDFCLGWIRSFRYVGGEITDERDWSEDLDGIGQVLSFGTDSSGEVYVATGKGGVYRLARADGG